MKLELILSVLALAALGFLIFPPSLPGSSVFYLSAAFLIAAFAFSSKGKGLRGALSYLRLQPKKNELFSLIGWGGLALVASSLATGAISLLMLSFGVLDSGPVAQKVLALPVSVLVLAFAFAPLCEELFFRGFLFRKISEVSGSAPAGAFVSTAIFAALHIAYGSISEIAIAFAVGLVLCAFTYRTKSLIPAVVAHVSFNLLSIMFILGVI